MIKMLGMDVEKTKNDSKNSGDEARKSGKFPCAFNVRASEKERKKLENLSSATGKSLSRLVIETTLSAQLLMREDVAQESADREKMIFELRRISVYLNQITAALHAAGRGDQASITESKLEETTAEIEAVISVLKKKL